MSTCNTLGTVFIQILPIKKMLRVKALLQEECGAAEGAERDVLRRAGSPDFVQAVLLST